ncbi:hypothetical protein FOI68_21580 [Brevibacillus sp. LEMMJ03]|uniref:hypothetical protein n=1 Tax=Brevibacillus sp. LEMMJ03 TaxID=2595056 RepID=UPI001181012A|nr:hypothetical protein [Brevibacillus sp. LEMMJ03]TRY23292.1 hypothetical protein FOI68_21580 [Brevibacillus sp. LEMMJ03]
MIFLVVGGGLLAFLLFLILFYLFQPSSTYRASILLEEVKPDQTWHRSFEFLFPLTNKYLQRTRAAIEQELLDADSRKTPEQIVIEQFVYLVGVLLLFLIVYVIMKAWFILVLGILLAVYFFFEPRRELKNKAKKLREEIRKETPNFALTVRLLLKGQKTPADALRIACEHGTGSGLKAYAEVLKQDLEFLSPQEAVQKFARSTKVPELIEFSAALSQYMTVGPGKDGQEILAQMESTFRELDKKLMEREKQVRPAKVKAMNMIIAFDGILFIATLMALYLVSMLSKGPAF